MHTVDTSSEAFWRAAEPMRDAVNAALDRYSQYDSGCPAELRDAIRHSLLAPGKRLRPLLVLMAAEACGCDSRRALPAACAVEMVHTYSLIHDDLPAMDDDELRRGRPSCHAAFGEATAILAGDALLAQAFEVLARETRPPEAAAKCCAELARAAGASHLVGGQADDLAAQTRGDVNSGASPKGGQSDLARLESIHRRKTGALLTACLKLGGLVAEADERRLQALENYGQNLGLAFQIVDDLLDLSGDVTTMGKPTGKDSSRGKLTFPGVLGAEASTERARQLLDDACQALAPLEPRTAALEGLAHYVLDRHH